MPVMSQDVCVCVLNIAVFLCHCINYDTAAVFSVAQNKKGRRKKGRGELTLVVSPVDQEDYLLLPHAPPSPPKILIVCV